MTNQTRSAVHDAATKAETLAYNLASASSLASVLSEVLDKEIGGTIEGQSLAALITLLDKLAEDCEELSGELYALSRGIAPPRPPQPTAAHAAEGPHSPAPNNRRTTQEAPLRRGLSVPSRPSAERLSRIMPLAVLHLSGSLSP